MHAGIFLHHAGMACLSTRPNLSESDDAVHLIHTRICFELQEWAIPGMGMFSEAYFIFSIGEPATNKQYMRSCLTKLAMAVNGYDLSRVPFQMFS